MAYSKLNLTNGTKLTAEHLAHIESGIYNSHQKLSYNIPAGSMKSFEFSSGDSTYALVAGRGWQSAVNVLFAFSGYATGGTSRTTLTPISGGGYLEYGINDESATGHGFRIRNTGTVGCPISLILLSGSEPTVTDSTSTDGLRSGGLTYSDIGAAPAGYGLGETEAKVLNSNIDLNTVSKSGWYFWGEPAPINAPTIKWNSDYGYMRVDGRSTNEFTQTVWSAYSDAKGLSVTRSITNGTPTNWVQCDPSAFAPAGYGLGLVGAELTVVSNADDATKNGWYFINSSTTNGVGHQAIMRTDCEHYAHCVQTAYGASYSSSTPLIMRRVKNGGAWGPWEWVNPPMELGVEYRTTERWNGKPVYAVLVNCGALPANSSKTVNICTYATTPVRAEWSIVNTSNPLRYSDISHAGATTNFYSSASDGITAVVISTSSNLGGFNAVLAYYYTKD